MSETAAENAQEPAKDEGFWSSVGSWLGRYWMYVVGGAVAVGGGYAAYRYLGEEDDG